MSEAKPKILQTRVQNKHDIAENWEKATGFRPLAGEIIIYDPDATHSLPRVKIGDGEKYVNQLDFIDTDLLEALSKKADVEHGTHVTFSTTAPVMDGAATVGMAATVARSDHKHPVDTSRAAQADFAAHTSDITSHMSAAEHANLTTAYNHSQAAHAPTNAEKNQNAFSNVVVGSTTIAADTTTDSLTLVAGSNVTITPDAANDKITIAATDTVYTHPGYTAKSSGLYKVTVDGTGHVSNTAAVSKADITALGIPAQDTTYGTGTATSSGLTKLYTTTGSNTDGTMTQNAITEAIMAALSNIISCGTEDPSSAITSPFYFKYAVE